MTVQHSLFRQELVQMVPFVTTDLRFTELTVSQAMSRDVEIDGVCYRRLDAQYFVWIERQMDRAAKNVENGRISPSSLSILQQRFEIVKSWVDENIGEKSIIATRKLFDTSGYEPPRPALPPPVVLKMSGVNPESDVRDTHKGSNAIPDVSKRYLYPPDGDYKYASKIDPDAVKLIDAIRDEALSKGWTMTGLYQNRGNNIAGKSYGLICVLDSTDVILKVEPDFITIRTFKGSAIPPEGEIGMFPNMHLEN